MIRRNHLGLIEVKAYRPSFLIIAFMAIFCLSALILDLTEHQWGFVLLPILGIGVAGTAIWIVISLYLYRIDHETLNRFKQWIIRDEILVITEIPKNATKALAILRHVESGHPYSYLLRPQVGGDFSEDESEMFNEPLTLENLNEQAKVLAASLQNAAVDKEKTNFLLNSLKNSENTLNTIRLNVSEAEHVEQTITTSAEWLLDNIHVIQGSIEEVRRNLPKKYYNELPKIKEGHYKGLPRVYVIAIDLVKNTANKLGRENIVSYLKSYQTVSPLKIGELWALQLILKFRLIECVESLAAHIDRRMSEGEYASFWGNRLLSVAKQDPDRLELFFTEMTKQFPNPSSHFAEELLDHLFDEEKVIPLVIKWLEAKFGMSIGDVIHQEQRKKTTEQIAFSNAVVSLITFAQLSWRDIFEEVSPIDQILCQDPENVYSQMNFQTRDLYRRAIELLGRRSKLSETQIAQMNLQLATHGDASYNRHVGFYLVDAGRPVLEKAVDFRHSGLQLIRKWMHSSPSLFYLGGIFLVVVIIESLLIFIQMQWQYPWHQIIVFSLLALLPVSELGVQLINFFFTQILRPFVLSKMSYEKGIPSDLSTFVVVPVILSGKEQIQEQINRLEIHYLANIDPVFRFGLLVDYKDAPTKDTEEDRALGCNS